MPIFRQKFFGTPYGAMKFEGLDQMGLLGPLATTKRPNVRSKCVVIMRPTCLDQLAVVWTKSGPLREAIIRKKSILRKSFANGGGHLVFIPLFFFKDLKGLHGSGRKDGQTKKNFHKTPMGGVTVLLNFFAK